MLRWLPDCGVCEEIQSFTTSWVTPKVAERRQKNETNVIVAKDHEHVLAFFSISKSVPHGTRMTRKELSKGTHIVNWLAALP